MAKRATAITILFLLGASLAQQTERDFVRYIPRGFVKAGDFGNFTAAEQYQYVMGFTDGLMASGILGADVNKVEPLHHRTNGMQAKQIAAIVDKYVKEHPESWHHPLAASALSALADVCSDLKKQLAAPTSAH